MHFGTSDDYEKQFNDMIGRDVVLQHPTMWHERYEGRCISIAWHPTMTIEYSDGHRVSRPVEWARLKEEVDA